MSGQLSRVGALPPTLADLRQQLAQAVRAGADTAVLRRQIATAERAEQTDAAARARAIAQRQSAEADRAERVIDWLLAERRTVIRAALRGMFTAIPNNLTEGAIMEFENDPQHRQAVAELMSARQAAEAGMPGLEARRAEVSALSDRVDALQARRIEIARRRAQGDAHQDDAGEIGLLDLDLDSLAEMKARAASVSADLERRQTKLADAALTAERWLGLVETMLKVNELLHHQADLEKVASRVSEHLASQLAALDSGAASATLATLVDQTSTLAARLLKMADQVDALARKAGRIGPPAWGAPPALLLRLRHLAIARGEL